MTTYQSLILDGAKRLTGTSRIVYSLSTEGVVNATLDIAGIVI